MLVNASDSAYFVREQQFLCLCEERQQLERYMSGAVFLALIYSFSKLN
jgi:hypothetical protein